MIRPAEAAVGRDDRIRVLHIIARMNVGGPAQHVTVVAGGLDTRQFDVRVLTGRVEAGEEDYLALHGARIDPHRIPTLGRSVKAGDSRALGAIIRHIRAYRPHVVHTHTAKAGILGRVAAKVCRVPRIVHTYHGHLLHGYFSARATTAVVAAERLLAPMTDRLVTVGERVRDELLDAGIGRPRQYVVQAPGVPLLRAPSDAAARTTLGIASPPVVTFVGRLTAIKRPDRFIDMALEVAQRHADVRFLVVGEGPLEQQLRTQGRALGDRVHFTGFRGDVETVYAASDVVVSTSDNEGMPLTLIEAAQCGVPAVTTDVGSSAEVVVHGRTGIVTAAAVRPLADAVTELLADTALRTGMGNAAAQDAQERFSTTRLLGETEFLYRSMLAPSVGYGART